MTGEARAETGEVEQHPRFCQQLLGHDSTLDQINVSGEGRTHQSFLFSGPRGIGKASAAWTLAARLLSEREEGGLFGDDGVPGIDPAEKALIEAASHPDLLAIEPDPEKASRIIGVDQIREIIPFFALHPSRGSRRIIIIDALDDVNYNGANAMLKALEEPPEQALMILINHETRPVLATIRSRCSVVKFSPLDFESCRDVIGRNFPDVASEWLDAAAVLADGAPGKAVLFAESGAVDLYAETCTQIAAPKSGAQAVDELARQWGAGGAKNKAKREAAVLIFDRLLSRAARQSAGISRDAPTMDLEEQAIQAINARIGTDELAELHQITLKELAEAEQLNLDAAIPLYAIINSLCGNAN